MVDSSEVVPTVRAIYQYCYMYGYPAISYVSWSGTVKMCHHSLNTITIASLCRLSPQNMHMDRIITSAMLRAVFNGHDPDLVVGMTRCNWLDHISEKPWPQPTRSSFRPPGSELQFGDFVWFKHAVKYVSVSQFSDVTKRQAVWRIGRICKVEDNQFIAAPMYHISYLRTTGRGYRQPLDWAVSRNTVCRVLRGIRLIAGVDEIQSLTTQW